MCDSTVPTHAVERPRPAMSLFAELLGLRRRGDPAPWTLGRRLDGRRADLPVPPVGRLGLRSAARGVARRRELGAALEVWPLAFSALMIGRGLAVSRFETPEGAGIFREGRRDRSPMPKWRLLVREDITPDLVFVLRLASLEDRNGRDP